MPLNVNPVKPFINEDGQTALISYDYYRPEFHFCQPEGGAEQAPESLGSILFGDRIWTSPFDLRMKQDVECAAVCSDGKPVEFSKEDGEFVNTRIRQSYLVDWLIDGLPAAMMSDPNAPSEIAVLGFPLGMIWGTIENSVAILNNHFELVIDYHKAAENQYRVVGIQVWPDSQKDNRVENGRAVCGDRETQNWLQLSEEGPTKVTWTYKVRWRESSTVFATRWDKYLHVVDSKIHWFWLINSAVIVCLLVGMVSTILVRALRQDIARYNRLDEVALEDLGGTGIDDDGIQEDSGWKLVHGDVFRPPTMPLPLSVLVGNGVQLFLMTGCTIGISQFIREAVKVLTMT